MVETIEIERIMCPIDFSNESEKALRFAADLTKGLNAELSVIQVLPKQHEGSVRSLCDWMPTDLKKNCILHEMVKQGDFIEQILETANDLSADLIVIGTNHNFLRNETLSNKTVEIIRQANCPVLIISD